MAYSTKQILAETLKALLREKPLDQITVTELVRLANVNRQTFYYNFRDIYALAEWLFQEEGRRVLGPDIDCAHWRQAFSDYFAYMRENRPLILNAFSSYSRPALEKYIKDSVHPLVDEIIRGFTSDKNLSEYDIKFMVKLYVLILVQIAFEWIEQGNSSEYESDVKRFINLMDGSTDILASRLKAEENR